MLYSPEEINDTISAVTKNRTASQYLQDGTAKLAEFLAKKPRNWMHFGPYWGVVQRLMRKYQPSFSQVEQWNDGQPVPYYLLRYDYKDDLKNLVAALCYLNRDGEYLTDPETPHSIVLPNGDLALYVPGTGLLETTD